MKSFMHMCVNITFVSFGVQYVSIPVFFMSVYAWCLSPCQQEVLLWSLTFDLNLLNLKLFFISSYESYFRAEESPGSQAGKQALKQMNRDR